MWIVWRVAKRLRGEGMLSLYNLAEALFIVEKEYEKKFGQKLIRDELVWRRCGPYPWRLEVVLDELSRNVYINTKL
ncbi:MAG: hypothetical protein QW706_08060 [Candidatus Nezhaarchaeales archaeon]